MIARKLNVVELYAGTARSAEPFKKWSRARIALLVDNDSFAKQTYELANPGAPYLLADLNELSSETIEAQAGGRVDILLGCPPCQGFSDTGLRARTDPRNTHLYRFWQFANELRPKAVAMENVPLAAGLGRRFTLFAGRMERIGYRATWGILNSANRGSCQCRHRLVYVAIRDDVKVSPVLPPGSHGGGRRKYFSYSTGKMTVISDEPISMLSEPPAARRVREDMPYREVSGPENPPWLEDVIGDLPRVGTSRATSLSHFAWSHTPVMKRRMANVEEGGRWAGGADHFSHSYGRLHRQGLARTITTFFSNPGSGRFWHPVEDRALSLREAARIQGFEDSFPFQNEVMRSCRLIGNALDGALAQVTYRVIREALS